MAVRTSPAGGPPLPDWARTRRGSDPGTVHLTVVDPGAVSAAAAEMLCAHLNRAGYRDVLTNAMAPEDARVLLDAGFLVREALDLFARPLDAFDAPALRLRRPRRLDAVAALDHRAFGRRGFDVAAIEDALRATPVARIRAYMGEAASLGYAVTGISGRRAYVQRLAVDPGARRRGIGRDLVLDGLRWARRRGARTAVVNTHAGNDAARALYVALGFVPLPDRLLVLERAL